MGPILDPRLEQKRTGGYVIVSSLPHVFTNKVKMPECQAKYCTVLRGQGYSTFAIPDPKTLPTTKMDT